MISLKTKRNIVFIVGLLILIMSLSADYIRTGSFQGFGIKQIAGTLIAAVILFRCLFLNYRRLAAATVSSYIWNVPIKSSFWRIFRLVFIIFFLYLLGDALYRWAGFRHYSSFLEFLLSLNLITAMWGIISFFVSLIIWAIFRFDEWISEAIGWKTNADMKRLTLGVFLSSGAAVWLIKSSALRHGLTPYEFEKMVFYLFLLSIFITWAIRKKSVKWISIIDEKISPLVWGFGIAFVISLFIVPFQLRSYQPEHKMLYRQPDTSSIISEKKKPNIILVTFDALAAEDMSVYGYQRETTPFLSEWATASSLFANVQAESNSTRPTAASLMMGKRFWTHHAYHIEGSHDPLKIQTENLLLLLMNYGYYNMAFIGNRYASVDSLNIKNSVHFAPHTTEFIRPDSLVGYIELILFRYFSDQVKLYRWLISEDFVFPRVISIFSEYSRNKHNRLEKPIDKTVNAFLEVIDSNPPEPFFAWIHFWPPHAPYFPPSPHKGFFADSAAGESKSELDESRILYDEYIRYCDKEFESFMEQMEVRNMLRNTIIIVHADHGESFKHDYMAHGDDHLYEQVTRVPLIIKEPGQTKGRVIYELSEQIDIPVTILDLANIPAPPWMEGRSLVPLMQGKSLPSKPAFSMAFTLNPNGEHRVSKGTIAVWEGDYKLIRYLEEEKSLLFNLKQDPGEMDNLIDREPKTGARLLDIINTNLKRANEKIRSR